MADTSANVISVGEMREALLSRVRAALRSQPGEAPSPPAADEALVRLCSEADDVVTRFEQQAKAVGMEVSRATRSGVAAGIADVLVRVESRYAVVDAVDEEVAAWARSAIGAAGSGALEWQGAESLPVHLQSDVAITDVDAAIADTGSLVISSGARRSRACHLLPRVHIAVVRETQILPDLLDYWRMRPLGSGAAATVLITGPSKTADIEGVLITGVHGPGAVCILIVDEENAS